MTPSRQAGALPGKIDSARRLRALVAPLGAWLLLMQAAPGVAVAADDARRSPATVSLRSGGPGPGVGKALSPQAREMAEWIAQTGDHAGAPFVIVDKQRATVLVFGADARLRAQSAVLLGAALGDDSVPGIGTRPMEQIRPAERTTPAGRFVAERGHNAKGEDIVWVDYDAAVSMHRVRTANRSERRAQRLATPSIADNRISYGCINVPVAFYEAHVQPVFAKRNAVVYVLPDRKPLREVFGISPTRSAQAGTGAPTQMQRGDGGSGGGFASAAR